MRKALGEQILSALPSTPDIGRSDRYGGFVPEADSQGRPSPPLKCHDDLVHLARQIDSMLALKSKHTMCAHSVVAVPRAETSQRCTRPLTLFVAVLVSGAVALGSSPAFGCYYAAVKMNLPRAWNSDGPARGVIRQGIDENNVSKIFDAYHSRYKNWPLIHSCSNAKVMTIARKVAR
jgi:hypothetical protein